MIQSTNGVLILLKSTNQLIYQSPWWASCSCDCPARGIGTPRPRSSPGVGINLNVYIWGHDPTDPYTREHGCRWLVDSTWQAGEAGRQ